MGSTVGKEGERNAKEQFFRTYSSIEERQDVHYGNVKIFERNSGNSPTSDTSPSSKAAAPRLYNRSHTLAIKESVYQDTDVALQDLNSFKQLIQQNEIDHQEKHTRNLVEIYECFMESEERLCSSVQRLQIVLEYLQRDLQIEIKTKKLQNQRFTPQDIITIALSSINALSHLQKANVSHGNLRTSQILVSECYEFKLLHPSIAKSTSSFASMIAANQGGEPFDISGVYLSPILTKAVAANSYSPQHNDFKSDVFTLGMILLECCVLLPVDGVYDYKTGEIQEGVLQQHLQTVKSVYGQLVYDIIVKMIKVSEPERPDFLQLAVQLNVAAQMEHIYAFQLQSAPSQQTQQQLQSQGLSHYSTPSTAIGVSLYRGGALTTEENEYINNGSTNQNQPIVPAAIPPANPNYNKQPIQPTAPQIPPANPHSQISNNLPNSNVSFGGQLPEANSQGAYNFQKTNEQQPPYSFRNERALSQSQSQSTPYQQIPQLQQQQQPQQQYYQQQQQQPIQPQSYSQQLQGIPQYSQYQQPQYQPQTNGNTQFLQNQPYGNAQQQLQPQGVQQQQQQPLNILNRQNSQGDNTPQESVKRSVATIIQRQQSHDIAHQLPPVPPQGNLQANAPQQIYQNPQSLQQQQPTGSISNGIQLARSGSSYNLQQNESLISQVPQAQERHVPQLQQQVYQPPLFQQQQQPLQQFQQPIQQYQPNEFYRPAPQQQNQQMPEDYQIPDSVQKIINEFKEKQILNDIQYQEKERLNNSTLKYSVVAKESPLKRGNSQVVAQQLVGNGQVLSSIVGGQPLQYQQPVNQNYQSYSFQSMNLNQNVNTGNEQNLQLQQSIKAPYDAPRGNGQLEYIHETYDDQSQYVGEKLGGLRHGQGKFFYADGGYYMGEWKEGRMEGVGTLYYPSGNLAYHGNWRNDQFNGKGTVYNENPNKVQGAYDFSNFDNLGEFWIKYEGDFLDDNKEGMGAIFLSNGDRFVGRFSNDFVHGQGQYCKENQPPVNGIWECNHLVQYV